jgi:hypothetical protein
MPPPNDDLPPGTRSSDDLKGLQILLVEDSPDIGELVKSFLEDAGKAFYRSAASRVPSLIDGEEGASVRIQSLGRSGRVLPSHRGMTSKQWGTPSPWIG